MKQITEKLGHSSKDEDSHHMRTTYYLYKEPSERTWMINYSSFKTEEG